MRDYTKTYSIDFAKHNAVKDEILFEVVQSVFPRLNALNQKFQKFFLLDKTIASSEILFCRLSILEIHSKLILLLLK